MSAALDLLAHTAPWLLGTAGKQRLAILIYHRVLSEPDSLRPGEPTVAEFDWQMRLLRKHFAPLSLCEAVERLQQGSLPARAVCVTFDDGYADNERLAMPVLRKHAVPGTVFISTGFLDGGRMFNDTVIEVLRSHSGATLDLRDMGLDNYPVADSEQRLNAVERILTEIKHREPAERARLTEQIQASAEGLPDDLMMTREQVRSLASNGVDVGAHTVNHPILASVTPERARDEIARCKSELETLLQRPIKSFAYPNGRPNTDYRPEHRELVQELGFEVAVSTHWGVATQASDHLQLPRFTPWDRTPTRFALRLLLNYRKIDPLLDDRGRREAL